MKPVENYSRLHYLGKPVRIVIDTDIIGSTTQYNKELVAFCKSLDYIDLEKTNFSYKRRFACDSFRLQLREKPGTSLQRGLTDIHQYPQHYQAENQSGITGPFSKFLSTQPLLRCGVGLGSIGDDGDDPLNDTGVVYIRSHAAMQKFDRINKKKKVKAVVVSLFKDSFDFIINHAETVICATEGKPKWTSLRDMMINCWDELILKMREELEDKTRWILTAQNERVFCCSEPLCQQIELLKNLCLQYWESENPSAHLVVTHRLNEAYMKFINNKVSILDPDKEAS